MSLSDEGSVVVVLFDYTYENDSGNVHIKTGDEYVLLDKTNDEWWHVKRHGDDASFYVPAQYVRQYDEEESDMSCPNTPLIGVAEERGGGDNPKQDHGSRLTPTSDDYNDSEQNNNVLSPNTEKTKLRRMCSDPGPDYVNLDEFRSACNITPTEPTEPTEPRAQGDVIYENLQQIRTAESHDPPPPEEGVFQRQLVPYLPWDIYKEKSTSRLFYHNRDTGELMWKPPRKDKPTSGGNREQVLKLSPPTVPQVNVSFPSDSLPCVNVPPDYEEVKEDGEVVYFHKKTNQKWYSNVDQSGQRYFYTSGKEESFWELPTIKQNGEASQEAGFANNRRNVERMFKAKSMYEGLDLKQPQTTGPLSNPTRSSTLPPSFIYPADQAQAVCAAGGALPQNVDVNARESQFPFEEQLRGYLNKAKIFDAGKRVKKNWSVSYVVLQGSNLVFYKDHKVVAHKAGSPQCKPELVISIQGARFDLNPSKELTSKKNVIMMTQSSGNQILLQSDDEKLIRQWFHRLKLLTDDSSMDVNPSPRDSKLAPMIRSVSDSDVLGQRDLKTPPAQSRNFWGIRSRLISLISRRPAQEDLVRRGIIKHVVFGTNLRELTDREHSTVPKFVKLCVAAIESRGLTHDGLYRISGNQAEIQRLRFMVDKDECYNLDDEQWDINVLTGSLKLFFRELRDPLFPQVLFEKFKDAICKEKNVEKLRAFKDTVAELPRCNYDTIKFIIHHLRKVIDKSHENRMQTQNVAIVFGPTLMWIEGDVANMAIQTIYQGKVIEYVLLEFDQLFR